jgi:hypothetical protein
LKALSIAPALALLVIEESKVVLMVRAWAEPARTVAAASSAAGCAARTEGMGMGGLAILLSPRRAKT